MSGTGSRRVLDRSFTGLGVMAICLMAAALNWPVRERPVARLRAAQSL